MLTNEFSESLLLILPVLLLLFVLGECSASSLGWVLGAMGKVRSAGKILCLAAVL